MHPACGSTKNGTSPVLSVSVCLAAYFSFAKLSIETVDIVDEVRLDE